MILSSLTALSQNVLASSLCISFPPLGTWLAQDCIFMAQIQKLKVYGRRLFIAAGFKLFFFFPGNGTTDYSLNLASAVSAD